MRGLLLAMGLFLMFQMPLQAQEAEARAIIDKAMKAQGDEKAGQKLAAIKVKAKGVFHVMDMALDFNIQLWDQEPDKSKAIIVLTANDFKLEIQQVVNGDKGWVSLDGNLADMDAEDIKEAKEMRHVERITMLFGFAGEKELKLTPLGDAKVGGKAVVGVKVAKKGNRDVSLYFDKATGLLAKAEYRAREPIAKEEVTQEKLFDNYKELVPGVRIASKITVRNNGQPFMEMDVLEIQPVDRHEDGTFGMPK